MKKVLVPLAPGFEELEAVTIIDLLRRAQIDVTVAGLEKGPITGSRGTRIVPDTLLSSAVNSDYDMLVLPGGLPGADNLNSDNHIHDLLQQMSVKGKYIAAICAAPKVLASAGLLANKEITSYPGSLSGISSNEKSIAVPGPLEVMTLLSTTTFSPVLCIPSTVIPDQDPG